MLVVILQVVYSSDLAYFQPLMVPSLDEDRMIRSWVSKSARSSTQSSWQALVPPTPVLSFPPPF